MTKSYTKVASFPSSSNPTKTYTVSKDEEGNLSCDCPAWKFKKGDGSRTCKHVQRFGDGKTFKSVDEPAQAVPVPERQPAAGLPVSDLLKRL